MHSKEDDEGGGQEEGGGRRKGCNLAPIRLPARIRKRTDRQVQPYVIGDNDRSRDSYLAFLALVLRHFKSLRSSAQTISNFICVPRNARTRRVRNSIRPSRTKNGRIRSRYTIGLEERRVGGRERHVSYYACAPQGWSKTDLRRRISTDGNELHIRPLREQIPWASSRKRGENRKSRINFLDIGDPIFNLYMKIICNIRLYILFYRI